MTGRFVPFLTSEAELDALPLDSIVGKDDEVYQRIHRDDDPEVTHDGFENPCVWAGIAFDNDPEYCSSGAIWYRHNPGIEVWYPHRQVSS